MWQGIPFKFLNAQYLDSLNIIITNTSGAITPTSTDFYGPALTGLATLIGGALPAIIAFRAIKSNKEQMLHQQIIINKQQFIDDLRLKISAFTAQAARLDVFVGRHIIRKGLTVRTAPDELSNKISDLAYEIDCAYNHIELMLGDGPTFSKLLELMNEVCEGFHEIFDGVDSFDVHSHLEKITKEAIFCISSEWKKTIDICQ